jgi:hypothetical protein
MADLSSVSTEELGGNYVILPEGEYIIQAVKAEDKTSKAGNEMVVVEFEVMDGDYEGTTLKHYFTFASEYPQMWAKKFADCADIDASNFCADTVVQGSPVKAKIEVEEGTEYIDKDGETQMGYDSNKINPFSFESAI